MMTNRLFSRGKLLSLFGLAMILIFFLLPVDNSVFLRAQNNNNNNNNNRNNNSNNNNNNDNNDNDDGDARSFYSWGYRTAIGGFSIDAENALRSATEEELASVQTEVSGLLSAIPADLDRSASMRKVSLRRLSELLTDCAKNGQPIPDSALFLGGLTRIDYVVAVPEENDIYLAGPAEGWTVGPGAEVVGKETGVPILRLEDLLTVIRSWNTPNPEVITCSIDPTKEGIAAVTALGSDADDALRTEAMGLMNVTFRGIPSDSRMARVLAAADYRLKTISLGYETISVKNFPSYFGMLKKGKSGSFGQRFWISPEYQTLYHDSDALAWKLTGTSVKTLTEREHFTATGDRKVSGKKDALAVKWATSMSKRYDEVADAVPVFAEAKNCMDLALTVALIYYKGLPQKSGLSLDTLTDASILPTPSYPVSEKVPGFSLTRVLGERESVSVTGGVMINPWETVESNVAEDAQLNKLASTISFAGDQWYAD